MQKTDEPPPIESGDALGNMTSELKANEYISEFVTGGPMNYGYKICNSVTGEVKTVCKLRGSTPNCKTSQLVNCDTTKDLVLNGRSHSIVTVRTDKKIKRKRAMVRAYR